MLCVPILRPLLSIRAPPWTKSWRRRCQQTQKSLASAVAKALKVSHDTPKFLHLSNGLKLINVYILNLWNIITVSCIFTLIRFHACQFLFSVLFWFTLMWWTNLANHLLITYDPFWVVS